jgi:DamX protein
MTSANALTIQQEEVATISVSARIDYVFKFSKQLVLAVSDNSEDCTNVSHGCLSMLAEERNTAYLSLSEKFTDIQVRCRILEQLFSSALFDPEKPLITVFEKYAGQQAQPMLIVLEQGQFLSSQLLFELCQLNEYARRHPKAEISILLTGSNQAKSLAAVNLQRLKNQLSVIDACSGQVIKVTSKDIRRHKPMTKADKSGVGLVKVTILLLSVIFLSALGFLYTNGYFQRLFSEPQRLSSPVDQPTAEFVVNPQNTSLAANQISTATGEEVFTALTAADAPTKAVVNASAEDILQSLILAESTVKDSAEPAVVELQVNVTSQTLAKDNLTDTDVIQTTPAKASVVFDEVVSLEPLTPELVSAGLAFNNHYFIAHSKGFVIQFGRFASDEVIRAYLATHQGVSEFYTYQGRLNGKSWQVLTSAVYAERSQAEKALKNLPEHILSSGVWIKSVIDVNNEIQSFLSGE